MTLGRFRCGCENRSVGFQPSSFFLTVAFAESQRPWLAGQRIGWHFSENERHQRMVGRPYIYARGLVIMSHLCHRLDFTPQNGRSNYVSPLCTMLCAGPCLISIRVYILGNAKYIDLDNQKYSEGMIERKAARFTPLRCPPVPEGTKIGIV